MSAATNEGPEILLRHHLKKLKLPTVLREHEKIARQCAAENVDQRLPKGCNSNWMKIRAP